jgi:hypothetical protein
VFPAACEQSPKVAAGRPRIDVLQAFSGSPCCVGAKTSRLVTSPWDTVKEALEKFVPHEGLGAGFIVGCPGCESEAALARLRADVDTKEEALRWIADAAADETCPGYTLARVGERARAALGEWGDESADPTAGLPPDIVRVLRDPTITIARDHEIRLADGRTLFEHLEEWRNAPSNTASADLPGNELE